MTYIKEQEKILVLTKFGKGFQNQKRYPCIKSCIYCTFIFHVYIAYAWCLNSWNEFNLTRGPVHHRYKVHLSTLFCLVKGHHRASFLCYIIETWQPTVRPLQLRYSLIHMSLTIFPESNSIQASSEVKK